MRIRNLPEVTAAARVRAAGLEAAVAGAEKSVGRMASPALLELFAEATRTAELLRQLELHEPATLEVVR